MVGWPGHEQWPHVAAHLHLNATACGAAFLHPGLLAPAAAQRALRLAEPTGNLDTQTGEAIFDLLHNLTRTEKTTIIAVTHDLSIAGKTDKIFKIVDGKLV